MYCYGCEVTHVGQKLITVLKLLLFFIYDIFSFLFKCHFREHVEALNHLYHLEKIFKTFTQYSGTVGKSNLNL